MASETIPAWVTTYALTIGIKFVRGVVRYDGRGLLYGRGYAHTKAWHRTPEDALARAEEMRVKKIASLKKQLAKLESLTFVAPAYIEDTT